MQILGGVSPQRLNLPWREFHITFPQCCSHSNTVPSRYGEKPIFGSLVPTKGQILTEARKISESKKEQTIITTDTYI